MAEFPESVSQIVVEQETDPNGVALERLPFAGTDGAVKIAGGMRLPEGEENGLRFLSGADDLRKMLEGRGDTDTVILDVDGDVFFESVDTEEFLSAFGSELFSSGDILAAHIQLPSFPLLLRIVSLKKTDHVLEIMYSLHKGSEPLGPQETDWTVLLKVPAGQGNGIDRVDWTLSSAADSDEFSCHARMVVFENEMPSWISSTGFIEFNERCAVVNSWEELKSEWTVSEGRTEPEANGGRVSEQTMLKEMDVESEYGVYNHMTVNSFLEGYEKDLFETDSLYVIYFWVDRYDCYAVPSAVLTGNQLQVALKETVRGGSDANSPAAILVEVPKQTADSIQSVRLHWSESFARLYPIHEHNSEEGQTKDIGDQTSSMN